MTKPRYVELHAASAFSFLEGASLPESLVEQGATLEMPAMALLDANGFYGSARFHVMAKKLNLNAHVGAETSVADMGEQMTPPHWTGHEQPARPVRLPLLCASRQGYQNLCQMITRYKMREETKAEGAALREDLEEFSDGLICMTGGDTGPLASALTTGGEVAGRAAVEQLVSIYGKANVYIELQRHQEREEEWRNQAALRIASSLRLPVVATNGVRYATPYDREILEIFTGIRHGKPLAHAGRLLDVNAQRHLRSAKDMRAIFQDLPQAIDASAEISQRLDFTLEKLGYEFPRYPVGTGDSMERFLYQRVMEGVCLRYGHAGKQNLISKATAQARRELALIEQLGFAGYFLIVWDIVHYCKRSGILIQGRGSAANSVVCYALEITAIDPIAMELLFERFLSESRGEWPDIDLDLPSGDKREQAIQYVYERYGELGAAMTANVITYRGKSAAREVGKMLGFDAETLAQLSSLVSHWEWRGPNDTMDHQFRHAGFDIRHPRIAKYLELCLRLQDLPRHLGQHSGGMVICQGQLDRVVPLERASMRGRTVVQWDKEDCAELGLIKVDLLGLGMMAVMKDCLELIPQHYGVQVDLAQLPQEDAVYKVLQKADTVGMFQVESRAQMASLPRNNPKEFYDLVVQVAIIRPGPIVGKMMHPYMRRRQKKEDVTYPHPMLESILKRTLGVPLFQEQLLRIAMIAANFTGAEAEELRRAVGMRRSMQRMKDLEGKLREGMTINNIPAATQDQIVQSISSFALYGFPESHAASFALIAYASAYFKVRYLAAFTCALLNNQPMGFYMPAVLVKDAQRHGLKVRCIDIQHSDWLCTLAREDNGQVSLRMGLLYAKGLRQKSALAIVEARQAGGAFTCAEDLSLRVPSLNHKELTQLASIGALNALGNLSHRRDALWQVEQIGRPAGPLLDKAGNAQLDASPLSQMRTEDRLVADYAGTGMTVGQHPMAYRRVSLQKQRIYSARELHGLAHDSYIQTAGCVIARQRPGTAMGFVFLSMEDETGISNIIIHPNLYERERLLVSRGKFLLIEGRLQNEDGVIHVKAHRVLPLAATEIEVHSHDFH